MQLVLVALTFLLWSSSFTIGKIVLEYTTPLFYTGIRMLFAGVLLLGYLGIRRRWTPLSLKQMGYVILLGIVAMYLTNFCEFWGLQYISGTKACFIYSLSPFLTACGSYFAFRERVTMKKWIGVLLGFLGFIPIALSWEKPRSWDCGLPELAIVAATILSVYGWILLRMLGKSEKVPILQANGIAMFVGGLCALVHSFFQDGWNPLPIHHVPQVIESVIAMVLISNLLCFNLYGYLLRTFTATFLSVAGLMTPLFASLVGYLILHEQTPSFFYVSWVLVTLGLYCIYHEELKLGYITPTKIRV